MANLVDQAVLDKLDQTIQLHLDSARGYTVKQYIDDNRQEEEVFIKASVEESQQHLLAVLRLAEARAWLTHPGQKPHGNSK